MLEEYKTLKLLMQRRQMNVPDPQVFTDLINMVNTWIEREEKLAVKKETKVA
jgi:hypothetical protein